MKRPLGLSTAALMIGLAFWALAANSPSAPSLVVLEATPTPAPTVKTDTLGVEGQKVLVGRVVDGDTIEIAGGQKVRYVGIDTPETVDPRRPVGCFGKEASAENKKLVEGKEVILTKDVSETDKFGRLLRFVYLKLDDGGTLFVNDYLVREGFARAKVYSPDVKFSRQFLQAENEAKLQGRGLWKACYN